MKISKEKLKEVINSVREINGTLIFNYIPSSKIKTVDNVANLYYSSPLKITIEKELCQIGGKLIDIKESNFDEIIDKVYECLKDDIFDYISPALDNLELDDCDLKYFDRNLELFEKFKAEVKKLKENGNNG